jgi:hypothetical protein
MGSDKRHCDGYLLASIVGLICSMVSWIPGWDQRNTPYIMGFLLLVGVLDRVLIACLPDKLKKK